jgi:hypothetical protein
MNQWLQICLLWPFSWQKYVYQWLQIYLLWSGSLQKSELATTKNLCYDLILARSIRKVKVYMNQWLQICLLWPFSWRKYVSVTTNLFVTIWFFNSPHICNPWRLNARPCSCLVCLLPRDDLLFLFRVIDMSVLTESYWLGMDQLGPLGSISFASPPV